MAELCYSFMHAFFNVFMYVFIFGCAGSLLLCMSFLYLQQAGAALQLVRLLTAVVPLVWTWALGRRAFSICGTEAQELRLMGSWKQGLVSTEPVLLQRHIDSKHVSK